MKRPRCELIYPDKPDRKYCEMGAEIRALGLGIQADANRRLAENSELPPPEPGSFLDDFDSKARVRENAIQNSGEIIANTAERFVPREDRCLTCPLSGLIDLSPAQPEIEQQTPMKAISGGE